MKAILILVGLLASNAGATTMGINCPPSSISVLCPQTITDASSPVWSGVHTFQQPIILPDGTVITSTSTFGVPYSLATDTVTFTYLVRSSEAVPEIQLGSKDVFGRTQFLNAKPLSVLRLGYNTNDGDPYASPSEGIVVNSESSIARIKPDRIGLAQAYDTSIYYLRGDKTKFFIRNNPGDYLFYADYVSSFTGVNQTAPAGAERFGVTGETRLNGVLRATTTSYLGTIAVSTATIGYDGVGYFPQIQVGTQTAFASILRNGSINAFQNQEGQVLLNLRSLLANTSTQMTLRNTQGYWSPKVAWNGDLQFANNKPNQLGVPITITATGSSVKIGTDTEKAVFDSAGKLTLDVQATAASPSDTNLLILRNNYGGLPRVGMLMQGFNNSWVQQVFDNGDFGWFNNGLQNSPMYFSATDGGVYIGTDTQKAIFNAAGRLSMEVQSTATGPNDTELLSMVNNGSTLPRISWTMRNNNGNWVTQLFDGGDFGWFSNTLQVTPAYFSNTTGNLNVLYGVAAGSVSVVGSEGYIVGQSSIATSGGFFGNGAGLTDYTVFGSSDTDNPINIASTGYVGVSTKTVTLRGGRPLLMLVTLDVQNGAGASRTYTVLVTANGAPVASWPHNAVLSGNDETPLTWHDTVTSSPSGSVDFVVNIKSSSAVGAQTCIDSHLTLIEY